MNKNRLTNTEIEEISSALNEIKRLTTLETASFSPFNPEEDKRIKDKIRPWLIWFNIEASKIEQILKSNNY